MGAGMELVQHPPPHLFFFVQNKLCATRISCIGENPLLSTTSPTETLLHAVCSVWNPQLSLERAYQDGRGGFYHTARLYAYAWLKYLEKFLHLAQNVEINIPWSPMLTFERTTNIKKVQILHAILLHVRKIILGGGCKWSLLSQFPSVPLLHVLEQSIYTQPLEAFIFAR
jgi:hypothetical protein